MNVASVRLTLSFPPSELSPNSRMHWRKKAKVTADYREECGWTAKAFIADQCPYCGPLSKSRHLALTPPVRAVVTFVVPDRRPRDMDNLLASLKAAWDGLTDAGVLTGDDAARFAVERSGIRYEKGERFVEVELWSLEGSTDG